MLASLTKRVEERVSVIDRFLSLCEACDKAIANAGSPLHRELASLSLLPADPTEERVFRHCVSITHLYTIYEVFCESVVALWLSRLPRYRVFPSLPKSFRNAYRYGIARIVQDVEKRRYRHLSLEDVLQKYISSLHAETPWEFVSEALTSHEKNLSRSELEKMLHSVGLEGVWSSLERDAKVTGLTVDGPSNKSLEQWLLDLVTYRNDASHGVPDEILGIDSLREWTVFVTAFCHALGAFVRHRIVQEEAAHRPESVYGVVTKTFSNNVAVVRCDRGHLHVGDRFFFIRESDCTDAEITSLQVNDEDRTEVAVSQEGFEVGIQTSVRVPRNSRMIRIDDFV